MTWPIVCSGSGHGEETGEEETIEGGVIEAREGAGTYRGIGAPGHRGVRGIRTSGLTGDKNQQAKGATEGRSGGHGDQ